MLANDNVVNGVKLAAKLKMKQGDNEGELFEKAFIDLDDNNTD